MTTVCSFQILVKLLAYLCKIRVQAVLRVILFFLMMNFIFNVTKAGHTKKTKVLSFSSDSRGCFCGGLGSLGRLRSFGGWLGSRGGLLAGCDLLGSLHFFSGTVKKYI